MTNSRKITFNVPSRDRRKKNYTETGISMTAVVGTELVKFVQQDNGDIAHYATGGIVLKSNSIKARLLSRYVANPYDELPSERVMAAIMIGEIDPDHFNAAVAKVPVINV